MRNRINVPAPTKLFGALGIDQITVSRDQGGCGRLHKKGKKEERLVIDCHQCAAALAPDPLIGPKELTRFTDVFGDSTWSVGEINFAVSPEDIRLWTAPERETYWERRAAAATAGILEANAAIQRTLQQIPTQ